ncbi:MAG: DUF4845 domain-containing protein [Candidatus Thiodiazotropha sp.]|nr:DUF4845 domain-containing protein [Candidatus Thiodiazotropha taylori]MBT3059382.1 DUF4845 domain-containing protein [Candidatus Thiodiazotropha sp. (ex Lucina pensylvanica)]MBV2094669.1 DUF4845 domain-containing protein [Candidatus Thiodiazotropha sp. (ex Codakia orbicularis)]PUB78305.1 MAG: hypothetical protein DBP03_01650 [gamma proteobacterium symbiont of Ctena orbiculata]MBT3062187.1 DUF4845 domain-containing protein [Candidatus Thiodiazotropha sp. (ex Lucina pensylvanica)]
MQSLKKQKGLTTISWLVIFIIVGFLVYVGIKITPVYIDHYAVVSTLKTVQEDPLSARKSKKEIREMITKRLYVNNIRHVNRDHIKIQRSGKVTTINVAYVESRPIVYNISLVMTFDESIELTAN